MGGDAKFAFGLGRVVHNRHHASLEVHSSSNSDVGVPVRYEFWHSDHSQPLLDRWTRWDRGTGCGHVVRYADLKPTNDWRE